VLSDPLGIFGFRSVVSSVVRSIRLDDSDDSCRVDRNRDGTDSIGGFRDEVRLSVGREEALVDVVKTSHRGKGGVDFDDDFLRRLEDFGSRSNGSTRDD